MKKRPFDRCLRSVTTMTSAQRHDLKILIERRDKKDLVAEVASLVGTPTAWSHCHHPEIRPWGHAAGLHRYRCQGCKRTFGPLMNTPLAGLHHKDRWITLSALLVEDKIYFHGRRNLLKIRPLPSKGLTAFNLNI